MASGDLDPFFVKALKLLQSRSKESYFQLKQMHDEVVSQRRAEAALKQGNFGENKHSGSRDSLSMVGADASRKRDVSPSYINKLKQDIAELSQEIPAKKLKLESTSSSSASSSPRSERDRDRDRAPTDKAKSSDNASREKPRERLREIEEDIFFGPSASSNRAKDRDRLEREKQVSSVQKEKKESVIVPALIDSGSDTEVSDDAANDETAPSDQMQFDLDIGNLSCVICNSMSISSTNRLVECQECHSLYHQDCHKPPVTEDVNDPRFVWYCCKCTKNLKKIVVKSQKKPLKSITPPSARDSPVSKPVKADPPQILQPFKRPEAIKPTVVKEAPEAVRGLAGLAKNLNSRSTTSASSSAPASDPSRPSKSNPPLLPRPADPKGGPSSSWGNGSAFSAAARTTGGLTSSHKPSAKATTASSVTVSGSGGSTVKMSQSTMMSADRRLQNMKKKAKLADKRPR